MKVKDLDLPKNILDFYENKGIVDLNPPQEEAVKRGVLNKKNIFAAIPTASGKTFISELGMHNTIKDGGKALYIVPLIALADEKKSSFKEFEKFDIKIESSTGDLDKQSNDLGKNDIIITTSEKADSLIRNEADWLSQLTTIVIDEVHLVGSENRGPTLEVIITKLKTLNPDAQFILLSATVGNSEELAEWLNAELIQSTWRPVQLKEGIILDDTLYYPDYGEQKKINNLVKGNIKSSTAIKQSMVLTLDTIDSGNQCLVFDSTRKNCESFAYKYAKEDVGRLLNKKDPDLINELEKIGENIKSKGNTSDSKKLAECVKNGVAYHHAGLNRHQREIIEKAYRERKIKVIVCTPTLSAGINLPARRVIIKNYRRMYGPIEVLDYKQIVGRAGRPGLDSEGESFLIAKSGKELDALSDNYVYGEPEDVTSHLSSYVEMHVLSTIVNGFANTRNELLNFFKNTFWVYNKSENEIIQKLEDALQFLEHEDMIVAGDQKLHAKPLGKLTNRLYISPKTSAMLINGLNKVKNISKIDALSVLALIAHSDEVDEMYPKGEYSSDEIRNLYHKNETTLDLLLEPEYHATEKNIITTYLLKEWINEETMENIATKFEIGEGDIYIKTSSAEWIMYSLYKLSDLVDIGDKKWLKTLLTRIKYGVSPDIVELVSLKDVGRKIARNLKIYADIRTIDDLKEIGYSNPLKVQESIKIGSQSPKIASKIFNQIGINLSPDDLNKMGNDDSNKKHNTFSDNSETNVEYNSSNKQKTLMDF